MLLEIIINKEVNKKLFLCLILLLFDFVLTIFFYYIREQYLNNIKKQKIIFSEYLLIICFIDFIIIIYLLIKTIIFSKIASVIYMLIGTIHILYIIVIQIIDIIIENKDIWKNIYYEKHINLYLLIICIIIGIIRFFSFKNLKLYRIKIKNLDKFLKNEEKDFFLNNLNEKLNLNKFCE